jgi:hypothetical protein
MGKKEAVSFDEEELLELEIILVDEDSGAALEFLKRAIWKKLEKARQGRLKCHLNAGTPDPLHIFQHREKSEE